jgi:thiamine-phosphate pyrophosphorylase
MFISAGTGAPADALLRLSRRAGEAGIPLALQLREKALPDAELLRQARRLVQGTDPAQAPVVVNGRLDVALAAGAAGVHLPARGAPLHRVRQAAGEALAVGVSTHSPQEVRSAAAGGADYIVFGPVFSTPSKAGMGEPQGLAGLERAVEAAGSVPLLAVGGVTTETAGACRETGAWGVAVIRALLEAADPLAALHELAGRP